MASKTVIPYTILTGTGNDFVLVDTIRHRLRLSRGEWAALARVVCAEEQAGTDGLLVLGRSRRANVRMRIVNRDGSEASMCGNGIRCLAWYAHRTRHARTRMSIETNAGVRHAEILRANRVRVNMGAPTFLKCLEWPTLDGQREVETDLIDSGVPHLVCWVKQIKQLDVQTLGQWLRFHRRFQPAGANVDFVEDLDTLPASGRKRYDRTRGAVVERWTLPMRTYERGVEAETQACGTGAVAAAAALAHLRMPPATELGRESDLQQFVVDVQAPGGVLRVHVAGKYLFDPAIGPRALPVGPSGVLQRSGGRDVAPGGAWTRVPRALPVGLHTRQLVFKDAFLEGAVRQVGHGTLVWHGRGQA